MTSLGELLREVMPSGTVARAATVGRAGTLDAPESERRAGGSDYLYALRCDRIQKPPAHEAWWVGLAGAAVTKERWFNGALLLFICGHFTEFARVLLSADQRHLPRDRKRELIRHVHTVALPTRRLSEDELLMEYREKGLDELAARRALEWERKMPETARVDRSVWSLDGAEHEALRAAWSRVADEPPNLEDPTIAACYLASIGRVDEDAVNISLSVRAAIANTALLQALSI